MIQWPHSWMGALGRAAGMALLLGLCALPGFAAKGGAGFNVTVDLQSGERAPTTEFCRTSNAVGGFGATVTVVCSTGAVVDISSGQSGMPWVPMHGGAYRYLFHITRNGEVVGTVDSYTGVGTVTSWRIVQAVNRDYLELTVGW